MRLEAAGKRVIVVLLNARESAQRLVDAENVQRFLTGQPFSTPQVKAVSFSSKAKKAKVRAKGKTSKRKRRVM